MESRPERVKVVVIGAGQAGLSVAFYLRRFELVAVLNCVPGAVIYQKSRVTYIPPGQTS